MDKRLFKKIFAAVLSVAMIFNINVFSASAEESIKVKNVYTNVQKLTMATGTKRQITTYTMPEDATNQKMRFVSSSNKVAKVTQNGVVTAVAPGTATITVTARDGSKAFEKVTVNVLKNLVIDKSNLDSDGEVIILDGNYGNVTIDSNVGTADIYLSGVEIKNKLLLEKGNYNVYLYESSADSVEVAEATSEIKSFAVNSNTGIPGLFVYNNSEVNGVNSTSGLNFAQDGTSEVRTLIYEYSGDEDLDLNLEGFLGNVVINVTGKGSINYKALNCNIQNVTVTGSANSGSVQFSNEADSQIANLTVGGSATVNLQVPAATLNIGSNAQGSNVTVGAPVTNLNNSGSNTNINIGAPVTTLTSSGQGGNIQVQEGGEVSEKELSTGTVIKDNTTAGGAIGGTIGVGTVTPKDITIEANAVYVDEDFEDGIIDTAISRRGVISSAVVDDGTGNKAMLVSGRSQTYQGAAVSLIPFTVGATNKHVTISFTADVMYKDGPATATMGATVESDGYASVASETVNKGEWTTISGTYLVKGKTPLLYIELDNTNNYYVDNLKITIQSVTDLVPVDSITVDKDSETLGISGTTKLTATVLPSNAEDKAVTWFSSDPTVATVDTTGLVTAIKGGTATITAMANYNRMKARTVITVDPNIKVYDVKLNKEVVVLTQLGTTQLTAVGTLNSTPFTSTIDWYSDDESVATVDSTGLVTAVANGTAIISASITVENEGAVAVFSKDCRIVVDTQALYVNTYDDPAGAIGFTQMGNATLAYEDGHVKASNRKAGYEGGSLSTSAYNGKEIRITADVKHGSGTPTNVKITYNAGSTYTTVIDSGDIPVGEWATITGTILVDNASSKVYFESNNATCDLYFDNVIISEIIWAPTPITGVTLNKDTLTLNVGLEETLVGTIAPQKVTTSKVLNWSSSDTNVATVDSSGKVTAKAPGNATITVKTTIDGVSTVAYEDTCTVTVIAAAPKPADPIVEDFEGMTVGTKLTWIGYGGADTATVIEDPNDSSNHLLEVKPVNYDGAPILDLTIPTGNTLYDYSKISYKALWKQGDVGWKTIRVEVGTTLTGALNNSGRLIASYYRDAGTTTALGAEEITLNGSNSDLSGDIQLALGISCAGADAGSIPTVYYLDDITLTPKVPKVTVLPITFDFDGAAVTTSSIGLTASTITTATMASEVSADFATPSAKMLKVVNGNYNTIPKFSITLPAGKTLADFTQLTAKYYGVASTDSGYKPAYLYAGTTLDYTGADLNSGAGFMATVNNGFAGKGTWNTVTFDIDPVKAATVTGSAIEIGLGMSAPSGATFLLDDITLVSPGGSTVVESFEGTAPAVGSLGQATVSGTVITQGDYASLLLTNTSANVLKLTNNNWGQAVKLTVNLAPGTSINDYSSLTFKLYMPKVVGDGQGFTYKDFTISVGTTVSSTSDTTTLNEKYATAGQQGSWITVTSALTPATKSAIGSATTFEIALGCHTNSPSSYYLDDITLVPVTE